MEDIFQANIINWLRQGNELEAAMIMEKCDIEFHFVDLGWEIGTEREFMINDIAIYAPRNIYDQVTQESSKSTEQIERAIRASVNADMHIRNIQWIGKPANQVESPVHTMTLETLKKIGVERVKLEWQRTLVP